MTTAKMRVHELAKEIDKTSKEVLEACKKLGISANSAMNVLTDKEVESLKKELVPPPPKKKMTAVFRPQNSAQPNRRPPAQNGSRPQGGSAPQNGARPQGAAAPQGGAKPQVGTVPQGGARPQGAAAQNGARLQGAAASQGGARPQGAAASQGGARPQGGTAPQNGARPQGAAASQGGARPQGAAAPQGGTKPQGVAAPQDGGRAQGAAAQNGARPQSGTAPQGGARPQGAAAPQGGARPQRAAAQNGAKSQSSTAPQGGAKSQGSAASQNGTKPQGAAAPQGGTRPQTGTASQGGARPQGTARPHGAARPQSGTAGAGSQRQQNAQRDSGVQASHPAAKNQSGQRQQNAQGSRSRDGQRQQNGQGSYSRDGQRQQSSQGSYSRDGQRQQSSQGSYSRDSQRQQNGQGSYSRDSQRQQSGQSTYSRDGQRASYNRDSSAGRGTGSSRTEARGTARSGRGAASDGMPPIGKPSSKQTQKQKNNGRQDRRYDEQQEDEEMFLKKRQKQGTHPAKPAPVEEEIKVITLPDSLTVRELADMMKVQPAAIMKKLLLAGEMVTINQTIDYEKAEEIAMDFDILCEHEEKVDKIAELLKDTEDDESTLKKRPPVVCVLGHVDHGKTSLLDAIRSTHVTDSEAGGITQRIGASVVECNGEPITFLDTPGHEAFTAMRMRGAQSTDIAILVVAADDGVMPQTIEAINHAKAAGVDIIVAINKIDKPGADVERVKQELTKYELVPEEWGGNTIFVPVSAKTHEGLDTLLEMILLEAEVKELKANPDRLARGIVIEAQLDKGRGPVATVLIQKGTLHEGDSVAVGSCYGWVRAMIDSNGRRVKEATPSVPVEITGLNGVPEAGETFVALPSEKDARNFAETYISVGREKLLEETRQTMSLDDLFSQIQAGSLKELNLIVKADVQGSVEALKSSLLKLSNDEVVVKIIHAGAGAINESDIMLAATSGAIVIGFNVKPDPAAKETAEREHVDIRLYDVIYQAIDDVEAAMKGMLDPVYEEQVTGHAVVRQLFKASGVGTIAGSFVTDGKIQRNCKVRISRDDKQIYEGNLASLKRFKDDVKEVARGYECGIVIEDWNDLAVDDVIEGYVMVEVPR